MQNTFIGMFVFENGKLLQKFCTLSFVSLSLSLSLSISLSEHQTILHLSFLAISLEGEIDCVLAPVINLCQHTRFLPGSANAERILGIHKMK